MSISDTPGFPLPASASGVSDLGGLQVAGGGAASDARGLPGTFDGLALDRYTEGLAHASGLVRLRASYTGPVMRVRRSSDNAERDIGFSANKLNVAALLEFVGAVDGHVARWYDQSGRGGYLHVTTASQQPKVVESGKYAGAVVFDGVDDHLSTYPVHATTTPALTYFLAGRDRMDASSTYAVMMTHRGTGAAQLYTERNTTYGYQVRTPIIMAAVTGYSYADCLATYPATYAVVFNRNDNAYFYVNGVVQSIAPSIGAVGGTFTMGDHMVGSDGANFARVAASAVVVYESAKTATEVASISALIKPVSNVDSLTPYTTGLFCVLSLKRLLSGYAGPCLRVRRSSDSAELDIGFDAFTRLLDTTTLLSFVAGGSGYVQTWYDQSGGGQNFTQTTASKQPRIVNAGVVETYGMFFVRASAQELNGPNSGTPTGITFYFKGGEDTGTATSSACAGTSTGYDTQGGLLMYRGSTTQQGVVCGQGNNGASAYTTLKFATNPAGQVLCMRGDRSQSTNATRVCLFSGGYKLTNNLDYSSGTPPSGSFTARAWTIGDHSGTVDQFSGFVADFVVYEVAQTDALIETISRIIG